MVRTLDVHGPLGIRDLPIHVRLMGDVHIAPILGDVTEAEYTATVLDLAQRMGWTRRYHTWNSRRSTEGYPDWTLIHEGYGVVLFVELKGSATRIDPEQVAWINALRRCGVPALISRPRHWPILAAILIDPEPASRLTWRVPQPEEEYAK